MTDKEIIELIRKARSLGVDLQLDGEKLAFRLVKGKKAPVELIAELKDKKAFIQAFLRQTKRPSQSSVVEIPKSNERYAPLSYSQEQLWVIDQKGDSSNYHLVSVWEVKGIPDVLLWTRAVKQIIQKHHILRTIYKQIDGVPYQEVIDASDWTISSSKQFVVEKVDHDLRQIAEAPFDLSSDLPIRVHLLQHRKDSYLLVLVIHHIASDGWSDEIFTMELLSNFNALREDTKLTSDVLPIQYADYATWQRKQADQGVFDEKMDYWVNHLDGVEPTQLPYDHQKTNQHNVKGASVKKAISSDLLNSLQSLANEQHTTLNVIMLTALKVILGKYSSNPDVCVGVASANRKHPQLAGLIGYYVNTLAIRTDLSDDPVYLNLIKQVQSTLLEAQDRQEVPLERIVSKLGRGGDRSLFNVMFELIPFKEKAEIALLGIAPYEIQEHTAKFDLVFHLIEGESEMQLIIQYRSGLFDATTVERMANHYVRLLEQVIAAPQININAIDLLHGDEKECILNEFQGEILHIKERTFPESFIQWAKQTPHQVALRYGEEEITYGELDHRTDQLAKYLLLEGLQKESPIAVFSDRSIELIVAMIAIMKSGGTYIPIAVNNPVSRVNEILEDAQCQFLLTTAQYLNVEFLNLLTPDVRLISLDEFPAKQAAAAILFARKRSQQLNGKLDRSKFYNRHSEVSISAISSLVQKFKEYWLGLNRSGSSVGLYLEDCLLQQIALISMEDLGVDSFVIANELDFDQKRDIIDENRPDILITESSLIDAADRLSKGSHQIRLVLLDAYDPAIDQSKKERDFQDIWNYTAERSHTLLNDYGWNNSYNGDPFDTDEINEYIDNFSNKLTPYLTSDTRVLEVGCGHGLLLFNLAPRVDRYFATDLSEVIIGKVSEKLAQEHLGHVSLAPYAAVELLKIKDEDPFDVVVCSSVVHYFPNLIYLECMILQALNHLSTEGIIYLDDLMDEEKRSDLEESTRQYNRDHATDSAKTNWENDLFVPKAFFEYLKHKYPEITDFECSPKQGKIDNELTRFRYDVMLKVKKSGKTAYTSASLVDSFGVDQVYESWYGSGKWNDLHDHFENIPVFADLPVWSKLTAVHDLPEITGDDLSYIIFTSGSTGKPKGAMVEHAGMLNHLKVKANELGIDEQSTVLFNAPVSFDISIWQALVALLQGGTTVIYSQDKIMETDRFCQGLRDDRLTHVEVVPSYLGALLDYLKDDEIEFPELQFLLVTGEAVQKTIVDTWLAHFPGIPIVNAYGPTEASDDITHYFIQHKITRNVVPIGHVLQNLRIYILDQESNLCPIGVPGELYVAGVGVGRGYLNRPELTRERYLEDTFSEEGGRLYRTGDLARWLYDGNIEFLGRIDDQVKIRGYRIELGEIEHAILEFPAALDAVVIAVGSGNSKSLVGYVAASQVLDTNELQAFLSQTLPGYMIPTRWMQMESFPFTPNGKVDKKKLKNAYAESDAPLMYVAPRNDLETGLKSIWEQVLLRENISINDNFFELGGDSIQTIQIVARAQKQGFKLRPANIFDHQTISSLAGYLSTKEAKTVQLNEESTTGEFGLLPIQKRFFEDQFSDHYNQALLVQAHQHLGRNLLQQALNAVIDHHETLRVSFSKGADGSWFQSYGKNHYDIHEVELADLEIEQQEEEITRLCGAFQQQLKVKDGELIKVVLIKTHDHNSYNRLLIVFHHLIIDAISWRVFLEDFHEAVKQIKSNLPVQLGPKGNSLKSWTKLLTEYSTSDHVKQQLPFWNEIKAKYEPLEPSIENKEFHYADQLEKKVQIDQAMTATFLTEANRAYGTQIFDLLLSSLALSFRHITKSKHLNVGIENHGRVEDVSADEMDLSRTMGWFTNLYPVSFKLNETASIADTIIDIKESLRAVPDKGLGYGVLRYQTDSSDTSKEVARDCWEVSFNYLGQQDNVAYNSNWFKSADESVGPLIAEEYRLDTNLEVEGFITGDCLNFSFKYNRHVFDEQKIGELLEKFSFYLEEIAQHCLNNQLITKTPADFELQGRVSHDKLVLFLENHGKDISDIYELTPMQEGMLFHNLYENTSTSYIQQFTFDVPSGLNREAFVSSWNHIIAHHSILRTGFFYEELDVSVQAVFNHAKLDFDELVLSGSEQDSPFQSFLKQDIERGFDYKGPPLMRLTQINFENGHSRLVWTHHHLLFDGWSLPVLLGKLSACYNKLLTGDTFPELIHDDYKAYVSYITRNRGLSEERFWKMHLEGIEEPTLFPLTKQRLNADRNPSKNAIEDIFLYKSSAFKKQFEHFAKSNKITPNTVFQGIWSYLLSIYTGKEHVINGVTVSGRPHELEGAEERIGLYINTIPFKGTVPINQSVIGWLQDLQERQAAIRQYELTSLSRIKNWTGIKKDLFDTLLVFENFPDIPGSKQTLQIENMTSHEETNFPLLISMAMGEEVSVSFLFNTELIDRETILMVREHFDNLLTQIVEKTPATVNELQCLTQEEQNRLLVDFQGAKIPLDSEKLWMDHFLEQVEKTPDHEALVWSNKTITYRELDAHSSVFAQYLTSNGLVIGDFVALYLNRCFEVVIGMIGAFKAGGVYLPLDPKHPDQRVFSLIEDVRPKFIGSTLEYQNRKPLIQQSCVFIDELLQDIDASVAETFVPLALSEQDLSYMLFTSGSTGKPKGALNTHIGLLNISLTLARTYEMTHKDRILQFSPFGFDMSIEEIFPVLIRGGAVVLFQNEPVQSYVDFSTFIDSQKVTILNLPPQFWSGYLIEQEMLPNTVRLLAIGGEQIIPSDMEKTMDQYPYLSLFNAYGLTEVAVNSAIHEIKGSDQLISIGRPVDNGLLYIVDRYGNPVAVGVDGEIWVGGIGMGPGYLNRPERTAESFISNPFTDGQDIIYKTGDLGRWTADGKVDYLGRMDNQVNLGGFRIELPEIEHVILNSGLVDKGVVAVIGEGRNARLVGYVVPGTSYDLNRLKAHLTDHLPDFMIPARMVEVEEIPTNYHGKTDKKSLPEPEQETKDAVNASHSMDEVEEFIAEIWKDLLRVEHVNVHDNFFEIGGDSIITIQIVGRAKKKGYALTPRDLFEFPTIEMLAQVIRNREQVSTQPIVHDLTGEFELSPIQRQFFELQPDTHFNQSILLDLNKSVSYETVKRVFHELANFHDTLRMRFRRNSDEWFQYYNDGPLQVLKEDLSQISNGDFEKKLTRICDDIQQSLSFEAGLFSVVWVLTPSEQKSNRLLIVAHHLIMDAVSGRVLLDDLNDGFSQLNSSEKFQLPDKSNSFKDWVMSLKKVSEKPIIVRELNYWKLETEAYHPIPTDFNEVFNYGADARYDSFYLSRELTEKLQVVSEMKGGYTFQELLISGLLLSLKQWCHHPALILGLEGHGRDGLENETAEVSQMVGWFTSYFPVSFQVKSDVFEEILVSVKNKLKAIPNKGIGYGLLKYMNTDTSIRQSLAGKPWDIVFNYLGQIDAGPNDGSWFQVSNESRGQELSDNYPLDNKLEVNSLIMDGALQITFTYSAKQYETATIQLIGNKYMQNLELILHSLAESIDDQESTALQLEEKEEDENILRF